MLTGPLREPKREKMLQSLIDQMIATVKNDNPQEREVLAACIDAYTEAVALGMVVKVFGVLQEPTK